MRRDKPSQAESQAEIQAESQAESQDLAKKNVATIFRAQVYLTLLTLIKSRVKREPVRKSSRLSREFPFLYKSRRDPLLAAYQFYAW